MARAACVEPQLSCTQPPPFQMTTWQQMGSESPPFSQLDSLWHFDCVISPRSPAAPRKTPHQYVNSRPSSRSSSLTSCPPPTETLAPAATATARPTRGPSRLARKQLLQQVFNTFDENGDGCVDAQEISRVCDQLGLPSSEHSLTCQLVAEAQGHMDEGCFMQFYESVCSGVDHQLQGIVPSSSSVDSGVDSDLLAAFHVFDKDGNGFISADDLQIVLCSLGFPQGLQLEACADMIARVDNDGDGQVDFSDFRKLFHLEIASASSIETF